MAASRSGETRAFRPAPFFDHGLFLLHLNRGKEEMARGRHEAARREFDEAQRLRPQDPEVLLNLSIALFHLGLYVPAEAKTRELLQEHEDSVPLQFNLGLILFKSGRDVEAKEPLERVLALAPAHRKAHLTLGLIAQRAGDYDEAQKHFKVAGAELKGGSEVDDSVARTARAAAAEMNATRTAPAAGPGSTRPVPVVDPEDTKPTAIVKPEVVDVLTSTARRSNSGVRSRSGITSRHADAVASPMGPFTPKPGGFLSADCATGLRVRRGVVVGRSGVPSLATDARLAGPLAGVLVTASGEGTILLADQGRVPWLKALANEFLSVEPTRLLAFDEALTYREDPAFEYRDKIPQPFLKLFGTGTVSLAVVSEPARFEVDRQNPLTLAARAVVAYGGDLTPELLEESDPIAGLGAGPVLRFVGTGYVLADAR
ncbi:MAG: tetratricopeptide repeat protein [Thermoanaerobaculia bacterium]|jgi:cytochrome c-type biogenesis protein CcmH/NrfG